MILRQIPQLFSVFGRTKYGLAAASSCEQSLLGNIDSMKLLSAFLSYARGPTASSRMVKPTAGVRPTLPIQVLAGRGRKYPLALC